MNLIVNKINLGLIKEDNFTINLGKYGQTNNILMYSLKASQ